jgi:hypothetical protein
VKQQKLKAFLAHYYHIVTFKELRKIIAQKNKELEGESKLYNPDYFWKGKKIVSLDQWLQIEGNYGLKAALQYFPHNFQCGFFPYIFDNIEDKSLKAEADQWYSDYVTLLEYSKNAEYGKTKCYGCLLSPYREEAAIFIGINKVLSRSLDSDTDIDGGVSVYPCKVLNRFACPYDRKIFVAAKQEYSATKRYDVDYLFYLSELTFAVELALAKAQEEDSVFRIRSAADTYQVLTNKETLEKVLQQGLKEEHVQYKDKIVEFFVNMKDRIKVEDLTVY